MQKASKMKRGFAQERVQGHEPREGVEACTERRQRWAGGGMKENQKASRKEGSMARKSRRKMIQGREAIGHKRGGGEKRHRKVGKKVWPWRWQAGRQGGRLRLWRRRLYSRRRRRGEEEEQEGGQIKQR